MGAYLQGDYSYGDYGAHRAAALAPPVTSAPAPESVDHLLDTQDANAILALQQPANTSDSIKTATSDSTPLSKTPTKSATAQTIISDIANSPAPSTSSGTVSSDPATKTSNTELLVLGGAVVVGVLILILLR